MEARRNLDAAHQIETGRACQRFCEIVPGKRVVVGDGQRLEMHRHCRFHQLRGAVRPVRLVGMRVKIDQKEISPSSSSLAQTRLALSSGASLAECTTTSGWSGGS